MNRLYCVYGYPFKVQRLVLIFILKLHFPFGQSLADTIFYFC